MLVKSLWIFMSVDLSDIKPLWSEYITVGRMLFNLRVTSLVSVLKSRFNKHRGLDLYDFCGSM